MQAEAIGVPLGASQVPPSTQVRTGTGTRRAQRDPSWVRWGLTVTAVLAIGVLIVIPIVNVFYEALKEGPMVYWKNLVLDKDTRHSIVLTLTVVPIALVANLIFGLTAAWCISRFKFRGRTLLTTLLDLPFSVSPVVAGLMFVLIFGLQGYFGAFLRRDGYAIMPYVISLILAGGWLLGFFVFRPTTPSLRRGVWDQPLLVAGGGAVGLFAVSFFLQQYLQLWPQNQSLKVIFALPGLVLATSFVTFPFIARELIPVMDSIGPEEDLAAVSLGASGWQMFWHVTVPNIKWGLAYGLILCNARAMGEFGAVYVVSGHIAGQTDTMPLRIEKLFQEYNLPGSFAVASVLTLLAILTLVVKSKLEHKIPSAVPGTGKKS
jgi:sulfate/thiosulfate transport system permease protein